MAMIGSDSAGGPARAWAVFLGPGLRSFACLSLARGASIQLQGCSSSHSQPLFTVRLFELNADGSATFGSAVLLIEGSSFKVPL